MVLACTMLGAMVIVLAVQVFFRYFLAASLIWAEELCRYLFVWITFLFAGAAFQRGEMVALELLIGRLPRLARAALVVPAYVLTALFLAVLVHYGFEFAWQNRTQALPAADFIWQTLAGRESELSIFWVYVSVPVGCALLALHLLVSAGRIALAK